MNIRPTIFRVLAVLVILVGLLVMLIGLTIGLKQGGLLWLLTALFAVLGGFLVSKSVNYFRRPDRSAAADLITFFSWSAFGLLSSGLKRISPETWGAAERAEAGRDLSDGARILAAMILAWSLYRILNRWLLEPAFPAESADDAVK